MKEDGPILLWKIYWKDSMDIEYLTWTDEHGKWVAGDRRPGVDN